MGPPGLDCKGRLPFFSPRSIQHSVLEGRRARIIAETCYSYSISFSPGAAEERSKSTYVLRTYIPDRRGLRRIVTQFDIDHVLVISSLFYSRPARLGLALIVREFIFSWRLIQPTLTLEHDVWIFYTSKSTSALSRAKITLASFIISASLAASRFAYRSVADDDVSENKSLSMSRLPMSLSTENRFQSTQYT